LTAEVLNGRKYAAEIRHHVSQLSAAFAEANGRRPALAAVFAGDDPASLAYVRSKRKTAEKCGIDFECLELPGSSNTEKITAHVAGLSDDASCDGILVELPLPPGCDERQVMGAIDPARDVDGVTPESQSRLLTNLPGPRPATAMAVMKILERAGISPEGARAVVVGRSPSVGKAAACLLLNANATVTICHSRTVDLASVTSQAEVLVAAVGQPGLITSEHVRPGATVVDVGTTVVEDGDGSRLTGDVDFESVVEVAGRVTPVPGGVGPVTTALVLLNTVELARLRVG
jgi:methylenetetrahydrofolate dehydrogenase (NADP+)/methenyltetrahydrofolate cyclohydrolase